MSKKYDDSSAKSSSVNYLLGAREIYQGEDHHLNVLFLNASLTANFEESVES